MFKMKNLNNYKLYFVSIFILSFINCLDSASIYYEKPSSARLAAAAHTPPACTYQNKKYGHGQQVTTPEPCLNCTCRKGVLLCFLRVCPTLIQATPFTNCITVREPGECCPKLQCQTSTTLTTVDTSPTPPSIPTTQFSSEVSKAVTNYQNSSQTVGSSGTDSTTELNPTSEANLKKDNLSLHYIPEFTNLELEEKSLNNKIESRVTVTQRDRSTTIFQTSPSTTFHESPLLVTSSPTSPFEEDNQNAINSYEGSCHLNGTVYAEGSAVISTSFCEYCYCIRSKRMCIRPRCHLSILGCIPRYTSEFACCPTSYVCGDEALTTLPMPTTTTTTTTSTESALIFGRKTACLIGGIEYKVGDPIASDQHCKQCYCSTGGIKKCKKIQCSPQMEGCVPVIPEGHCCPVEYKCKSSQQMTTESMKALNADISTESSELSESTTESNSNDLTKFPNNEVISDSTEPNSESLATNSVLNILAKTSSSSATDSVLSDENKSSLETTTTLSELIDTKTDSIESQFENRIKAQLLRSDSNYKNESEDLIVTPEPKEIIQKITEADNNESFETTTNKMIETIVVLNETKPKPDLYSENDITVTNGIEVNAETYATTINSIPTLVSSSLVLNSNFNFTQNLPINESASEEPISSSNTSSEIRNSNESNIKKEANNETKYESSVGVFLNGIIDAIDKQLQKRIPAEPRLKANNSDQLLSDQVLSDPLLLSKKLSDESQQKPLTSRSESKSGLPSLSSSFFITDDNETPYKSDSDGVEIITAKTAFYDLHENPGASILINLTPSSLKVSASPFSHSSNPSNDRHFDIMAQNNRAAIYGKPLNTQPQPYVRPNNDWRVVGANYPRKPVVEPPAQTKPLDSLYYNDNIRRHDSEETDDQSVGDSDKRPRLEYDNPVDRMKVIPFKINDAVAGLSPKKKNGSFLIRLSPNKNSLNPDSTPKSTQQISCFQNSNEYPNGAMIPKPDPCTLCRCFYGRELCQQQKCPAPPEKDCVPEKMAGYCCPRYICRVIEDPKATQKTPVIDGSVPSGPEMPSLSPIRKEPQFSGDVPNLFNTNNKSIEGNNNGNSFSAVLPLNVNHFEDKNTNTNTKEENEKRIQLIPEFVANLPQTQTQAQSPSNRFPVVPLEPTPKPFQRIPSHNSNPNIKQNENRIHFPSDHESDQKVVSVVSQPILSDSMPSAMPPNPNPWSSKPIISSPHHQQYNSANKYRLKPSMTMSQSVPSQPPFGSSQKPNLRLPPFLLHSHNSPNTHSSNNVRHKPNTSSASHSENFGSKVETNANNISISGTNENSSQMPSKNSSNDMRPESSTRSNLMASNSQSTTLSSVSNQSMFTTVKPTPNTTKLQSFSTLTTVSALPQSQTISTSTHTSTTTTSTPKSTQTKGITPQNSNKNQNTWDLFRVSGCNIYGTMYQIDAPIEKISSSCKKCICSAQGVKCTDIC